MRKLRIAITGATGLLGRNLLFEFLKQNLNRLNNIEIFILGRKSGGVNIQERIKSILQHDGAVYCGVGNANILFDCVKAMEIDLVEKKLMLNSGDYKKLKSAKIDYFFHVAALTDFRSTPAVIKSLSDTNVYGTKQIIELISCRETAIWYC